MSNEIKARLLGQPFGTATQRLRKLIMWSLVQETGKDVCFRCGQQIEDVDDLSIEHKAPWQSAPDPKATFFDLGNIAFSHLRCNIVAGAENNGRSDRTHCPQGHEYTENNTRVIAGKRYCRQCHRSYNREWMQRKRGAVA